MSDLLRSAERFADRVALVTGAAQGIGAAIAARLAAEGARVIVADVNPDLAAAHAETIVRAGGQASATRVDVADWQDVAQMVAGVMDRAGRLDVLVNNAGVSGTSAPVADYPVEEWRRVLSIDLDGVFYCCRAAVPHMVARGYGRIVNIASIAGKEGNPNLSAYSAAKAGVIGLTKSLAKELATTGVLVNAIAPAVIASAMNTTVDEHTLRYMVSRIPMGRTGEPAEVAALVAWLASEECSFSTGAVFDLSGGRATY